jgi:hypothetical protein
MRKFIVAIAIFLVSWYGATAAIIASANAQASDPCVGAVPAGDIGLNYEGHCVLVEPEKGPVQGILVKRVEDLDNVVIYGIIIAHTEEGWRILDDEFAEDVEGEFATAAVGDGYHIELDPQE